MDQVGSPWLNTKYTSVDFDQTTKLGYVYFQNISAVEEAFEKHAASWDLRAGRLVRNCKSSVQNAYFCWIHGVAEKGSEHCQMNINEGLVHPLQSTVPVPLPKK